MSPVHGLRPSPLRISKDSHVIQKSSTSSSLNQHQVSMMNKQQQQQQQREPVIIYTHSPQIIHTNPRDFMSLVQKLTGSSAARTTTSDVDDNRTNKTEGSGGGGGGHHQSDREKQRIRRGSSTRDHRDDEKFEGEINYSEGLQMKPYLAEIPLFTPNSTNLFFSPKGLLRNPDDQSMVSWSSSPGIAGSLSPSFMEFLNMKELPEY